MGKILWIIGTALLLLFLFATGIVAVRMAKPHSRKMYGKQKRLNKKTEMPGAVIEDQTGARWGEKSFEWLKTKLGSNLLTILLLAGIAAIIYWGLYAPVVGSPSMSAVGSWGRDHWLPILILYAVFAALVAMYAKKEWAGTLQRVLAGIVFMLFVGASIIGSFVGSGNSPGNTRSNIPLASAPQSSWPKLVMAAAGESARIAVPLKMHVVMVGSNFLLHNVYQDGHECAFGESCADGSLASVYATNKADETNVISYAFASN
ncbi:MAG: hypothetical protein KGJ31_01715 [Patescibacteria group bacterium]|nr:hypothetical protein [Patescibacteria group bacterium]